MKKTGKISDKDRGKLGRYVPISVKTWEQLEEFKQSLLRKCGYYENRKNGNEPYGA
jgi:hypothetical protein